MRPDGAQFYSHKLCGSYELYKNNMRLVIPNPMLFEAEIVRLKRKASVNENISHFIKGEKSMESIKRMFAYAGKRKGKLWESIILASLSVLLGVAAYLLVHRLIMLFAEQSAPALLNVSIFAAAILAALFLKTYLLGCALELSHINAYKILGELRKAIAEKLIRMPMGEIKKRTAGNLKMHIVDDVESMELVLAHMIPEGIANILTPLFTITLLFIIDWRMALLTLAVIPLGLIAFSLMFNNYKPRMEKFAKSNSHMNATIVEYISGMEVIKAFNQTTESYGKYTDAVADYKEQFIDWARHTTMFSVAYLVLLPASILFVLPFGGMFFLNGTITLSNYILCMLLALGFADPLIRLTNFFDNIALLTLKENAINQLLHEKELKLDDDQTKPPADFSITFDKVTFAYEEQDVLKDISFTCRPNTITALVGASGSGKSTIAKLIARFWDVDAGTITLGGVDTAEIPFETLMDSISYVSQDAYLFNTSIMENIRMGKPDVTDGEVIRAAQNAVCDEFVTNTKKGYETNAGDAGNRFSGGQKQRLSIARALLKDAPIVILDEATAFTDPENEDRIQKSINELIKGKTVIVIAHRLSTIVNADNIIVVDDGRISDQGTHEELLGCSLKYQAMWKTHMEAMSWDLQTKGGNESA